MSDLQSLLMASVRQFVLDNLPYDRQDGDVMRELSAMSPDELLGRWFNWVRRVVPPMPRRVLESNELQANPVLQQRRADIQALIADIQSGRDLTKYLSRAVKHGYVNGNGLKPHRRQDLDLMLSAWGVHHLHISQDVESDGFVKRDGPIIFAVFRHDKAFLIDVMTHQDWAREHVIRVMVDNWPNEGLVYQVHGVHGLSRTINDSERQQLRNAQINTLIEIDGKVYLPAGGMTASGVGEDAVRQADRVITDLEAFALRYEQAAEEIIAQVTRGGITWPNEPDFAVEFRPDAYGVVELKSSTFLLLGP